MDLPVSRFGNWICFRPQVKRLGVSTQMGPLERANINGLFTSPVILGVNIGIISNDTTNLQK
jgi:hypothetical protein